MKQDFYCRFEKGDFMYSAENIATIFNFRNQIPTRYEYEGNKPSDELILEALDLVRKFTKCIESKITLDIEEIDTVIRFTWNIGDFGIIQYTLSEDYLKLWVIDDDSEVLVNNVELDHNDYESVCFITKHYIKMIRKSIGEVNEQRRIY